MSLKVEKMEQKNQEFQSSLNITEERRMDRCTIYYESWQIQCCGDPFSVGDRIEWTCVMPTDFKNAHGIVIDLEEEHHGRETHSITGTVSKIIAERSEFPSGQREVWYDRAETIKEELQHADGWESDYKDNDLTEYTFWGYIVELKNVIVKPIKTTMTRQKKQDNTTMKKLEGLDKFIKSLDKTMEIEEE